MEKEAANNEMIHQDEQTLSDTSQNEQAPSQEAEAHTEADWKSAARKWETRSKQNYEQIKKLEEQLSLKGKEQEETQKQLAELQSLVEQVTQEKQRQEAISQVAAKTGVSAQILGMLNADSLESLEQQAQVLKEQLQLYPNTHDAGAQTAPTITKADIMKEKDPQKRKALIAEHMELFD